jgi:hypothetical protein
MATNHEHYGRYGNARTDVDGDSGSDEKGRSHHIDGRDSTIPGTSLRPRRTFEAPELIRNMTLEERRTVESRLKRKIDFRLLPMITLMYILNYLDRVSFLQENAACSN